MQGLRGLAIIFSALLICLFVACAKSEPPPQSTEETAPNSTMDYWDAKQRMGTNSFNNKPPSQQYFDAFAEYGGEWVRISWTKWESASGGAFLMNDPSNYKSLVQEDLALLKKVVARAKASGLKVVLTPLTLPGAIWTQHNNDEIDDRLYSDKKFWTQSAEFWSDLANAFKDDPAVAAYNLINEPTPERPTAYESGTTAQNILWYEKQKGTARDLPAFYNQLVTAIRRIDTQTPIMLDGGFFGNPEGFSYFPEAIEDENILYAFHMYKPWAATSVWNIRHGSKLVYPGEMKIWGQTEIWDFERVAKTIRQPLDWAEKKGIARSRVVMSEFGCHRYLTWCPEYMEDVLTAADAANIHWAFYTFRSHNWGGMDYELGGDRPSLTSMGVTADAFWKLSSQNRLDELPRSNTALFKPISRRLEENKKVRE
jgi:hypothetical protein